MIQINVKAVPSVSYGRVVALAKPICNKGKQLLAKLSNDKQFMKKNADGSYEVSERVTFSPAMVTFLRANGVELIISDLSDFVLPKVGQAIDKIKSDVSSDIDLSFLM